MATNWTSEAPTKDGYYWAKRGGNEPQVVQIADNGKLVTYTLYGEPLKLMLTKSLYRYAEWSGPIQPPAYPGKEKKIK